MTKHSEQEHAEVRQVADTAWDIKDEVEKLNARAMTADTARVLASAKSDLQRIKAKIAAELERRQNTRKRTNGAGDEAAESQQELPNA